jgi:hypothetical protein
VRCFKKNVATCNGSLGAENIYFNIKMLYNIAKKEGFVAYCNVE